MGKFTKGLSVVTGFDAISSIAKQPINAVRDFSSAIGLAGATSRVVDFIKGPDTSPLPDASNDPAERFAQAMDHYNLNESDITRRLKETNSAFWTYAGLAAVWTAIAVGSIRFDAGGLDVPAWTYWAQLSIFRWFFELALLGIALKHGIANWHFRTRRLGTWGEYLKSGSILPLGKMKR